MIDATAQEMIDEADVLLDQRVEVLVQSLADGNDGRTEASLSVALLLMDPDDIFFMAFAAIRRLARQEAGLE
jgi:hypothetical protein